MKKDNRKAIGPLTTRAALEVYVDRGGYFFCDVPLGDGETTRVKSPTLAALEDEIAKAKKANRPSVEIPVVWTEPEDTPQGYTIKRSGLLVGIDGRDGAVRIRDGKAGVRRFRAYSGTPITLFPASASQDLDALVSRIREAQRVLYENRLTLADFESRFGYPYSAPYGRADLGDVIDAEKELVSALARLAAERKAKP